MIRASLRTALLAPLLLAGCGLLDAKLEAKTVCFTMPDYPIPGVPSGSLSTDIAYDLGQNLPIVSQPDVSYSLVLQSMELSVGAGSPSVDLGGFEQVDIAVLPPAGSKLPDARLIQYVRGTDLHPKVIGAASSTDQDLAPYVSSGQILFHVDGTGTPPAVSWKADVKACFLLTVDVNYGNKL